VKCCAFFVRPSVCMHKHPPGFSAVLYLSGRPGSLSHHLTSLGTGIPRWQRRYPRPRAAAEQVELCCSLQCSLVNWELTRWPADRVHTTNRAGQRRRRKRASMPRCSGTTGGDCWGGRKVLLCTRCVCFNECSRLCSPASPQTRLLQILHSEGAVSRRTQPCICSLHTGRQRGRHSNVVKRAITLSNACAHLPEKSKFTYKAHMNSKLHALTSTLCVTRASNDSRLATRTSAVTSLLTREIFRLFSDPQRSPNAQNSGKLRHAVPKVRANQLKRVKTPDLIRTYIRDTIGDVITSHINDVSSRADTRQDPLPDSPFHGTEVCRRTRDWVGDFHGHLPLLLLPILQALCSPTLTSSAGGYRPQGKTNFH
jgi:hypothetical protein